MKKIILLLLAVYTTLYCMAAQASVHEAYARSLGIENAFFSHYKRTLAVGQRLFMADLLKASRTWEVDGKPALGGGSGGGHGGAGSGDGEAEFKSHAAALTAKRTAEDFAHYNLETDAEYQKVLAALPIDQFTNVAQKREFAAWISLNQKTIVDLVNSPEFNGAKKAYILASFRTPDKTALFIALASLKKLREVVLDNKPWVIPRRDITITRETAAQNLRKFF